MFNLVTAHKLVRPAAMVLAAGLVVGAIVMLPFWVWQQVSTQGSRTAEAEAAECWGCAPFEHLIDLFELQQASAAPEIRDLERRLGRNNLLPDSRLIAEEDLARNTELMGAADQALEVLIAKRDECVADAACRMGPSAFQQQTCGGGWPDARLHNSLTRVADQIFSMGSQCRGLSCPVVDCTVRTRLDGALVVLMDTLAEIEVDVASDTLQSESYTNYLRGLRAHLEQLPLVLPVLSEEGFRQWQEGLGALSVFERGGDEAQLVPSWRHQLLERYLQQLEGFAGQNSNAQSLGYRPWWPALVETASLALAQIHHLEWQPANEIMACQNPRADRLTSLRASLRRASAALSVCGARGGCAATEPINILGRLDGREINNVTTAADFLAAANTILAEELQSLRIAASDRVSLHPDLEAYGVWEAINVAVEGGENRCIAEEGAWLGLFPDTVQSGSSTEVGHEAILSVPLNGRASEDGAFLEAPDQAGNYEVRAFAPDARGGAELARAPLSVWPGPTFCEGFDGIWDTDFGELHMFVRGNDVRGTYRRTAGLAPGFFSGERDGQVLVGNWNSEIGGGGARLVLAADGQSFRGTWSHRPGQYAGTGQWNGSCVASE